MAGNRLFRHQGQLARSRQTVVKHRSALLTNLLICKARETGKRAPLMRRPLPYGGLIHEAWKRLPYFFLGLSVRTHRP